MLSNHLQTLLQDASSVSIVNDNAKCHHERCCSMGRSSLQYSHSDPFPRRRRTRRQASRWASEPEVVVCKTNNNLAISHTSSSSSRNLVIIRDRPPVLKCRDTAAISTFTCTTSLCSMQRNATKPSRSSTTTATMENFILQSSQTFPMMVNDKIKNLSTASLLELALSDINIDD